MQSNYINKLMMQLICCLLISFEFDYESIVEQVKQGGARGGQGGLPSGK